MTFGIVHQEIVKSPLPAIPSMDMVNVFELSAISLPKHEYLAEQTVQYNLAHYRNFLYICSPVIKKVVPTLQENMDISLVTSDGCVVYSFYDNRIGIFCPGSVYINSEQELKNCLLNGNAVNLYYNNTHANLVSLPISNLNSSICLCVTRLDGKVPDDLVNAICIIHHIISHDYDEWLKFEKYTNSIINTMDVSALIVNNQGMIANANNHFLDMIDADNKLNIIGEPVSVFFEDLEDNLTDPDCLQSINIIRSANRGQSIPSKIIGKQVLYPPFGDTHLILLFQNKTSTHHPYKFVSDHPQSNLEAPFSRLVGNSPKLNKVIAIGEKVAKMPATVLIEGESGTGKELMAQAIHLESNRKGSFVTVNCGGLPPGLLQSELFGYVEGSFTGAKKSGKVGKFEQADGGTLFLDEIGEMPIDMQVSLLRFLQDKIIVRLGDNRSRYVDVRIIAATNRDLLKSIEEGSFRQDLYYRLNVVNIKMPALRDRKEDIPLLTDYFIDEICTQYGIEHKQISTSGLEKLLTYDWPGNIRELRNIIENALIVSNTSKLTFDQLSIKPASSQNTLRQIEEQTIISLLQKYEGNISATAKALGIARTTLYRKMKNINQAKKSKKNAK
ncbi:sigma-54 interaction domain-containing protein [Syntrophomonas curvata]